MNVFVFLICLVGASQQAEWTYDEQDQWPGVCNTGRRQSPIDIVSRNAVLDAARLRDPLRLRRYAVNATARNDGHTVMWTAVPGVNGSVPRLAGGPLRAEYRFLQFHMHWLSEHNIDGKKFAMEIHMVHVKMGLTMDEAVKRPDGLAVIAVLCILKSGKEYEHALAQLMPVLPRLATRSDNQTEPEAYDLTRLLSPEPQSYFTYQGSLTTPECEEVVTWIVMDRPLAISDEQYIQFRKIDIGASGFNYRRLQPLANRVVYRSAATCAALDAERKLLDTRLTKECGVRSC